MYKTQIGCIIIIIFITIFYFSASNKRTTSSKWFAKLLILSILQLLFDITSVYTVNHLYTVPAVLNRVVHFFFMGFMLVIFYAVYKYLESIINSYLRPSTF